MLYILSFIPALIVSHIFVSGVPILHVKASFGDQSKSLSPSWQTGGWPISVCHPVVIDNFCSKLSPGFCCQGAWSDFSGGQHLSCHQGRAQHFHRFIALLAKLIILWSLCALVSSVASNSWKLEPLIKVAVCLLLEMADKIEKSRNLEELMNVMKVDLPGLSCSRLEDVIRQAGSLNITR